MEEKEKCEYRQRWTETGGGAIIEGHKYVETFKDERRQVLKCELCGHESIGYYQ